MKRSKTRIQFNFEQVNELEGRALMAMVGPLSTIKAAVDSNLTFPELDSKASTIALRVDQTQDGADAIKVKAGETFTLTFPDATKLYKIISSKPDHVQVQATAKSVSITALKAGFLGLNIASTDGNLTRYVGLYIGDHETGIVPDTNDTYVPLGTVTSITDTGEKYLQSANFQQGVAPIDYLYIYDQGGAHYYGDNNLGGLLKQAATYGMVPSVVYYNIQNMNQPDGSPTGVIEGYVSAFQSINNYNTCDARVAVTFDTRYTGDQSFTLKAGEQVVLRTMTQGGTVNVSVTGGTSSISPFQLNYGTDHTFTAPADGSYTFTYSWTNGSATPATAQVFASKQLFNDYMKAYFTKLKTTLATIKDVGVPTQMVMEPDFLGYMTQQSIGAILTQNGFVGNFVPNDADRTQNTVRVDQIYESGLLTKGVDQAFPNTLQGFVEAVNYAVAKNAPNVRLGWKTNVWAVADQRVNSLGLMHITDQVYVDPTTGQPTDPAHGVLKYPWMNEWSSPMPTWSEGRDFLVTQATGLAKFLKNVGTQTWTGNALLKPFIAIDKYGVDGAYTYDPTFLDADSQSAAFGDLFAFLNASIANLANMTDAQTQEIFGLDKSNLQAFYNKYINAYTGFDKTQTDVQQVFSKIRNYALKDQNLAKWFWNADQWNNYLYFVKNLSTGLDNTKVMLWQIPQGHNNGSTSGGDLKNVAGNFQDSATTYFFGDTFKPESSGLGHFSENQASDSSVSLKNGLVTWGEHMTLAKDSNVMSVLFGAGLGVSTRGTPTPAGDVNDNNFFTSKATTYLKTKFVPPAVAAGGAWEVTADSATWPTLATTENGEVRLMAPSTAEAIIKPFRNRVRNLQAFLHDLNDDGVPEVLVTGTANGVRKLRVFDANSLKVVPRLENINLPVISSELVVSIEKRIASNPGKELVLKQTRPNGRILSWIYNNKGRLLARRNVPTANG